MHFSMLSCSCLTRKLDIPRSVAPVVGPDRAFGATTSQPDDEESRRNLRETPIKESQRDQSLDSMEAFNGNMAPSRHHMPPTAASQSTQVVDDTLVSGVGFPMNMSVCVHNQPLEAQNSVRGTSDFVHGAFDSLWQFGSDLPPSSSSPRIVPHSSRIDDNQLLTLQGETFFPQPLLSPMHHGTVHGSLPPVSNLRDEITRFRAYIRTVVPDAYRIVIETEGDDGPGYVDLEALFDSVNYPGPA